MWTSLDFKPLPEFAKLSGCSNRAKNAATVAKPHQLGLAMSNPGSPSLAYRFSIFSASRFICNFICEYFLNTFASPCRNSPIHKLQLLSFPDDIENLVVSGLEAAPQFPLGLLPVFCVRRFPDTLSVPVSIDHP